MQEPLKILIISDAWHPQVNGVVRTYEHLSEELVNMGHIVKVVGPEDFPWKISLPSYPEIKLCLFPSRHLKKLIEEFNPNMIHLSVEGPLGWAGRKYCMKKDIRFSTSYHTHFPHYVEERVPKFLPFLRKYARKAGRWYVRTFHKSSSAMMVASPSLEENLRRWQFQNNIYRLTRGVNTELFSLKKHRNFFHDLKRPVALYVGRVAVEKNLEEFLRMEWEGTKVIVGDGPYRAYLERKYPDTVFLGKRGGEELADIYRSSDVFVFPSRTDTFGIVLIEALACGLPVAAYDVTGPKDIITEPYLGCLDEDLSIAAQTAMKNADAEKCHKYVETRYTWKIAAQQFLKTLMDK